MSTMTLPQANGSKGDAQPWLQLSVQQFFEQCNWEDRPARSHLPAQPAVERSGTLDLTLSVSQFFELIPWEGAPIIAAPVVLEDAITADQSITEANDFTLDDFSGLFG